MGKYIATKPVRFDRDYAVSEVIPGSVIDPRSAKRLIEAGKIALSPTDGLLGDGKEDPVAFLEDILGIDFDGGEPPDLEKRTATCKEIIVEIKNAAQYLKAQDGVDLLRSACIMGTREERLVAAEAALGISSEGNFTQVFDLPVDDRAAFCMARLATILEVDGGVESQNTAKTQETPQNAPQGAGGTNGDGQNAQEGAQESAGAASETPDDLTCPTCGKKCSSKAALSTHMKTHAME